MLNAKFEDVTAVLTETLAGAGVDDATALLMMMKSWEETYDGSFKNACSKPMFKRLWDAMREGAERANEG